HELSGTMWLVASLLYGTGMRLLEGLRLRVKDMEFERREIISRDGKGAAGWLIYSHSTGIIRPQGCKYHHDLYPRPEQRRSRYYQSAGYVNHP
ncbi:MAG: hypothetical protein ACYDDD_10825, partial [Acidithiobacillus ferrivorans]